MSDIKKPADGATGGAVSALNRIDISIPQSVAPVNEAPADAILLNRNRAKTLFTRGAVSKIVTGYKAKLSSATAKCPNEQADTVSHVVVDTEGEEGPFQILVWYDGQKIRSSRVPNGNATPHHGIVEIIEQHRRAQRGSTEQRELRRRTDSGNGERFVDDWAPIARYNASRKSWTLWTGKKFTLDRSDMAQHLGLLSTRRIYTEAEALDDATERRETVAWAQKSEDGKRRRLMVDLAKSDPRVATTDDDFDRNPDELNTQSGIVNLKTGELRPHDPEAMHARITGASFRPELLERDEDHMPRYVAAAPVFSKFMAEVTLGRRDLATYIQSYVGYAATGYATEELCGFAVGNGSNGKGTLTETLLNVLGDYGTVADPSLLLDAGRRGSGPSPEIAGLKGVRFLVLSESDDSDRLSESRFKWLTGGDTLTGRHLYGEAVTFRPVFTPWFQTNHRPRITTGGYSVWRRVAVIPFEFEAREGGVDKALKTKLRGEADAVLAWIVEGAIRWFASGLPESPTVGASTSDYKTTEDRILPYISEETRPDMTGSVKSSALYKKYREWSQDRGEHPMSAKAFHAAMAERDFKKEHFRDGDYYINLQFSGGV